MKIEYIINNVFIHWGPRMKSNLLPWLLAPYNTYLYPLPISTPGSIGSLMCRKLQRCPYVQKPLRAKAWQGRVL